MRWLERAGTFHNALPSINDHFRQRPCKRKREFFLFFSGGHAHNLIPYFLTCPSAQQWSIPSQNIACLDHKIVHVQPACPRAFQTLAHWRSSCLQLWLLRNMLRTVRTSMFVSCSYGADPHNATLMLRSGQGLAKRWASWCQHTGGCGRVLQVVSGRWS